MNCPKFISFDLEGTLVDEKFSEVIWNEGIPNLYSSKHSVGLESAKQYVLQEYANLGDKHVEWYDISYWFKRFDLVECNPQELINRYLDKIRYFPEVTSVLKALSDDFRLIIVTNSSRTFLEVLVREIKYLIYRTYSVTSDFKTIKNEETYLRICRDLDSEPTNIVHVGDHLENDFHVPRRAGLLAYHLDRRFDGTPNDYTIRDLKRLLYIL
jgi:HAD superfamily hydrolase (TIGR01549 family)